MHAAVTAAPAPGPLTPGSTTDQAAGRWARLLGPAVLTTAVFLAHSGSFAAPFLFDGLPLAQGLRRLETMNSSAWLQMRPRLFGYLTFDLQYTLHGLWLPGFHAVNLAIHAVAACLLFAVVRETLARSCPAMPPRSRSLASFASAALWGLHPLQTHSVTYLYQRFESLMGLLFLGSIWCLLTATRRQGWAGVWLTASYICFLAALATKEVAVMAPIVLVLFDRAYLAASWREILQYRWAYYAALFGTVAAGLVYVVVNWSHYVGGGLLVVQRVSVWQYLRTQPEIVGHYLRQAIWPDRLSIDPAWPVQDDPVRLAFAWLVVAAVAAGTAWLWRADKRLAFLPLAFVLILVPTSSIAPVIDLAFEHRVYLSLAPVAVAVTLAVMMTLLAVGRQAGPEGGGESAAWWAAAGLLATAAVALAAATAERNRVHESPLTLWGDTVLKSPHNTRAWANLGIALEEAGDPRAAGCYEEIIAVYRGAAGRQAHPLADMARRTPRTIEYVWFGFVRLATRAAEAGDLATARRLYAELERLPCLPQGGLDRMEIKSLRERLMARKAG